jgi:hypothetical protein
MRKLIVSVISSLDGYAAGEGGNVFVMPIDLGFDRYNLERMRAADTMLFGAVSFLGARNYWPPLVDDASVPEVEREISRLHNTLVKVVISDSTAPEDTAPWSASTEIVRRRRGARPGRRTERPALAVTSSASAACAPGMTCSRTAWSTSCTSWSGPAPLAPAYPRSPSRWSRDSAARRAALEGLAAGHPAVRGQRRRSRALIAARTLSASVPAKRFATGRRRLDAPWRHGMACASWASQPARPCSRR